MPDLSNVIGHQSMEVWQFPLTVDTVGFAVAALAQAFRLVRRIAVVAHPLSDMPSIATSYLATR